MINFDRIGLHESDISFKLVVIKLERQRLIEEPLWYCCADVEFYGWAYMLHAFNQGARPGGMPKSMRADKAGNVQGTLSHFLKYLDEAKLEN